MKLKYLLENLETDSITCDNYQEIEIDNIVYDSRKVRAGSLFICIEGFVSDGHMFIEQAIKAGAVAVMVQKHIESENVCCIKVKDTRVGLAHVSTAFFEHPSQKLSLIGITGTKGKTTATFMVRSILNAAGKKTGLIGTITNMIGDEVVYASRTTPESYELQSLLDDCVKAGIDSCVMEVSSQGLSLDRVYGCEYEIGVFTNLYNDHVGPGEHKDIEDYWNAKAKLFDMSKNAVINVDADFSDQMIKRARNNKNSTLYTFGIKNSAMISARDLKAIVTREKVGTSFLLSSPWYVGEVFVGMPGEFNVYNALSAIACAGIMGISFESVLKGLSDVKVKGRVEPVKTNRDFQVVVDYAHNAASLENLLKTLKSYVKGRIICVFGCGGDRAKSRRFEMGEVSGSLSDLTVITSDNPRTEDPNMILVDIETGVKKTKGEYIKIIDRTQAIKHAIVSAKSGDMVVIAGKGHENYQIFADKTIHYDDVEVAASILNEMN